MSILVNGNGNESHLLIVATPLGQENRDGTWTWGSGIRELRTESGALESGPLAACHNYGTGCSSCRSWHLRHWMAKDLHRRLSSYYGWMWMGPWRYDAAARFQFHRCLTTDRVSGISQ